MKIVAMMRIKNEEEFIERCIKSALQICDEVVLFDDHSTDRTRELAEAFPQVVFIPSHFTELSETNDKNFLLQETLKRNPDWVLCMDGDEELSGKAAKSIMSAISVVDREHPAFTVILLQVLYLWNDYRTIRVDGVYGNFWVPRVFTTWDQDLSNLFFLYLANKPGFHCGSIPSQNYKRIDTRVGGPLYHYGYLYPEQRRRKLNFYTKNDPGNELEGFYLHITQGDPGGAAQYDHLKHAGPLRLEFL